MDRNKSLSLTQKNLFVGTMDIDEMTPDYFVDHYKELIIPYIGKGRPSSDTLNTYYTSIDQFIQWCHAQNLHPLKAKEFHLLRLREIMYQREYRQASVNVKIVAISQFFRAAVKLEVIKINPAADIQSDDPERDKQVLTKYLTEEQLQQLIDTVDERQPPLTYARNVLLLLIMGVEGLRTVEAHRLSLEDINWDAKVILIKGKGHDDFIYPNDMTFVWIQNYLDLCMKEVVRDKFGTPLFVSDSNNNYGGRLSRKGIRYVINTLLSTAGLKQDGLSCHLLRHTCGTLLFAKTKNLQVVKETLRHRDVKQTSKYAHLQERLLNRYTSAIAVQPIKDSDLPHTRRKRISPST